MVPCRFGATDLMSPQVMIITPCWKGSSEEKKVQPILLIDYDFGMLKKLKIPKSEKKS